MLKLYLHSPMDNFIFYPCIGDWVSSRDGLEAVAKRTIVILARNRIFPFQPAAHGRYIWFYICTYMLFCPCLAKY
jgi:hypothetical protein